MRTFGRSNAAKKWARFALKAGLLFTDAKLWESINSQLRDWADDMGDNVKRQYNIATDRLQDAQDALYGRSNWVSPALSFVSGIGLGVGVAMLLTPVSGQEARSVVRGKVVDMKNRVRDAAAGVRSDFMETAGTGTD
jgi:gas vesicle protein